MAGFCFGPNFLLKYLIIVILTLGGICYGVARVCAKCFFSELSRRFSGSESYVVSNSSQYCQEERHGKIKLMKFVIFYQNFFFLAYVIKLSADC